MASKDEYVQCVTGVIDCNKQQSRATVNKLMIKNVDNWMLTHGLNEHPDCED